MGVRGWVWEYVSHSETTYVVAETELLKNDAVLSHQLPPSSAGAFQLECNTIQRRLYLN